MSNDNPGRTARTSGNAPMGSTVAIVVTAVALILGFLILRKVNDNSPSTGGSNNTAKTTTTVASSGTTTTQPSTTTTAAVNIAATKVQVANASGTAGVAKQLTLALQGKGYDTATATNASPKAKTTKVLYNASDASALGVAKSVAALLGGVKVVKGTEPLPTTAGTWATGTGVLVVLGSDLAGKTLEQIAASSGAATTTAAAPAGT